MSSARSIVISQIDVIALKIQARRLVIPSPFGCCVLSIIMSVKIAGVHNSVGVCMFA